VRPGGAGDADVAAAPSRRAHPGRSGLCPPGPAPAGALQLVGHQNADRRDLDKIGNPHGQNVQKLGGIEFVGQGVRHLGEDLGEPVRGNGHHAGFRCTKVRPPVCWCSILSTLVKIRIGSWCR
jgi:hypothetical protein